MTMNKIESYNNSGNNYKHSLPIILLVFLVIYISDSLLFATSTITLLNIFRRLFPLLCASIFLLKDKRIDMLLLVMSISIIISLLWNFETNSFAFYITQIGYFLFAYFICRKISFLDFTSIFLVAIRIIAAFSLFGYFLSNLLIKIDFLPVITNSIGNSFKTLFFTNVPIDNNFSSLSRRNWGPFWEPGAFQFYLNVGVICSLFRKNKYWFFDVLLFSITLLTTMSGASILSLPFIFLAFFINRDSHRIKWKWLIFVVAVIIVAVLVNFNRFSEILNKILATSSDSESAGYRIGSLLGNIKATFHNPLFGVSSSYQQAIRAETIYSINGVLYTGNVNTLLGYYSFFGIPIGILICCLLFKTTNLFTDRLFSRLLLFAALIIMSSNENLMQSALMCVLIFYGYVEKKKLICGAKETNTFISRGLNNYEYQKSI